MDNEDTQSYTADDIDAQLSPGCAETTDTECTVPYASRCLREASESASSPTTDEVIEPDDYTVSQDVTVAFVPDFRTLVIQRPMSGIMAQDILVDYCHMAQLQTWSIRDVGIHEYFQQYPHCSTERTEIYDQICAEVHGSDIQHTVAFFHDFLENEHLEHFYAELYRLLYWSLRDVPGVITRDFPYDAIGARAGSAVADVSRPSMSAPQSWHISSAQTVIDVLDSSSTESEREEASTAK